jgi:voltage-gated potassium channel
MTRTETPLAWDLALVVLAGTSLLVAPLSIIFPSLPGMSVIIWDIVLTLIFCVDSILLRRNRSQPSNTGTHPYCEGISVFPLLSLFCWFGINSTLAPLLALNRLFRLPSLFARLRLRADRLDLPRWLPTLGVFALAILVVHWVACLWLTIYPEPEMAPVSAYIKAFYWAVTTMATVGYGDITPTTDGGRLLAVAVMLLGVGFYGVMIGHVSALFLASDKHRQNTRERLDELRSFFRHYDVPPELQSSVLKFYNHLLSHRANENEERIISELPHALQSELQVYMNLKPISRVRLFEGCSGECFRAAAHRLIQVFHAPGDIVVRKGEPGDAMYLIGHGELEVLDGERLVATLGPGQCFGEMALVVEGPRHADVRASTYCDLFKLTKEKFLELTSEHPDLRANAHAIASERLGKPVQNR